MKFLSSQSRFVAARSSFVLFLVAVMLALYPSAHAQTWYTWSADGTNNGGSGTWNTSGLNWRLSGAGSGVAWPNLGGVSGSGATFIGTAGTVTVDTGGVTVGFGNPSDSHNTTSAIRFQSAGWTLTGAPITFGSLVTNNNSSLIYFGTGALSGNVAVNNNLVLNTVSATDSYTQVLVYARANTLGNTITLGGNIGLDSSRTGGTVTAAIRGDWGNTQYGDVSITGQIKDYVDTGSGAKLALSVGSGAAQYYAPIVTLSGANTYTGGTAIYGNGRITATNSSALGTSGVAISTDAIASAPSLYSGGAITLDNSIAWTTNNPVAASILGGSTAAASTFSGSITRNGAGAQSLLLTAASGGTTTFSGNITETTGTFALTKIGTGTAVFSGAGNTYSGGTAINDGTLLVNSGSGTGAVTVNGAAAASGVTGTFITAAQRTTDVTVASTAGLSVGQSVTGTNIQAGTVIAQIVDGTTIRLSLANTANVASNTLNFGSTAGTLGGTGTIGGAVTVNSGGSLAPGDPSVAGGIGTLTTSSALTFNTGAAFKFELNSTAGTADKMVANGVTINSGTTFSFVDLNYGVGILIGQQLLVIDNTSGSSISGAFGNLTQGGTITNGSYVFTADYFGGVGGNDLVLIATAVPEPGVWGMLMGGMGALLIFQRMRKRKINS